MNDEAPPILKKPMTLTIDLLWAAVFTEWGGAHAIRNNEDLQSAVDNFISQLKERIAAACSHFGIVPGELGANLCPLSGLSITHSQMHSVLCSRGIRESREKTEMFGA